MSAKVLLFTTQLWPTAAMLGDALQRAGLSVSALRPGAHPLRALRGLEQQIGYQHPSRHRLLSSAIQETGAQLVIPCDDLAVAVLHEHHELLRTKENRQGELRILERSLGAPTHFEVLRKKSAFVQAAAEAGICVPETILIKSREHLKELAGKACWPKVIKGDGWWSGRGTIVVHSPEEALRAYDEVLRARTLLTAFKDAGRAGSLVPLYCQSTAARGAVTLQAFAPGRALNRAVYCEKGQVIAGLSFEALESFPGNGAATVVRLRDVPQIDEMVARCVELFGLSGFAGFDFMYDEASGQAYLLEVNPRATSACYTAPAGVQPLAQIVAEHLLARTADKRQLRIPTDALEQLIALFPQEIERDAQSPYLSLASHQVPWHQPDLVRDCVAQATRQNLYRKSARVLKSLLSRESTSPVRGASAPAARPALPLQRVGA